MRAFSRSIIFMFAVVGVTALASFCGPAKAGTVAATAYARTEIIPEAKSFAPGETLWFAVRQELKPGWHVFWVNPGDAGLPLEMKWTLPEGYVPGGIVHPLPEYIPVGPLASYAHLGAPVFLTPVTAPADAKPGDSVAITIEASWQTCEDICVPEEASFSFTLPVTAKSVPDRKVARLFAAARDAAPPMFEGESTVTQKGGDYVLEIDGAGLDDAQDLFFFAAAEGLVEPSAKQTATRTDGRIVVAMQPGWTESYSQDQVEGVLTWRDKSGARAGLWVSADAPAPLTKPAPASRKTSGLAWLLLLAFAGGAMLNIMPCVFPIVFIKAASWMRSAQEAPAKLRAHGLYYASGVVVSFLLLGALLLALRAGGEEFGWGFHLQSPAVVAISAYILILVGLSLAGVYTIGENFAGAGGALAEKSGAAGAFFTGALAVVVAAPCIGPLLSAPMGAALLLPAAAGMAIFAALGLGLAAPYLALSFAPGLGKRLPKPGPWMTVFKQALAFPVFAAAAYFFWVLSQQAAPAGFGAVLAGSIFIAFSAWAFERSKGDGKRALALRVVSALAALAAIAPLFNLPAAAQKQPLASESFGAMSAEPYSAKALAAYRAKGVPVFIDFTAAWCVTCQFDKATVFSDAAVAAAFKREDAVFMVADWTVRDPAITEALADFGASGVPFYAFYPAKGEVKTLPPPITKKAVLAAVSGS